MSSLLYPSSLSLNSSICLDVFLQSSVHLEYDHDHHHSYDYGYDNDDDDQEYDDH